MTIYTMNYTKEDSNKDQYPRFSESIKERFAQFRNKPLFTTNADGLFEAFLNGLPQYARQHYTCNCCRNFINRFGGLVSISEDGEITSALWNEEDTPKFFAESVRAMKEMVLNSRVNGVFISSERVLGTPHTGEWDHMSLSLPSSKVHRDRLKTAGQKMAEKKEDFRIFVNALLEYSPSVVNKAVRILKSEAVYRSDRFLGVAKFFQEQHQKRQDAKNSRARENLAWLAVATAPNGFCHVKNSMIGTLLDDLNQGYSVDVIADRFANKMGTYMRSTSAPTSGGIYQAEKLVEKLGIAESLERRYARFDEIPEFIWKDKGVKKVEKKAGGVFGHLAPKGKSASSDQVDLPSTVMTYEKFKRTVLPTADSIEVKVDNHNRLMALVTANVESAPNILQWDNTFSWYYHGGIDGEIKRRVESAGGQYENNEIRCSLIWEGETDLDLHCITPNGDHIFFGDKRKNNGWLDVDMNASPINLSYTPVENIRWNQGQAPEGYYRFYVNNCCQRGEGRDTSFKVELEVNGRIYTHYGSVRESMNDTAFYFSYVKGKHPLISSNGGQQSAEKSWNVPSNGFVKVNGITSSPNQWGDNKVEHIGHHIFFLLDGVKDTSEGNGRGFFNETLKPELHEIRKTLEAYTASTPIEGVEEASACGVGYSKDSEWNLIVKVTTGDSTRLIKIDRWD